jgi:predicted RNA-binding protein with PIN domain
MQKMIIDGYNVIYADGQLKTTAKRDLLEARRTLIGWLSRYLERKNLQISLVFDGHGGITDVDIEIPGKLQVLFSSAGQSADEIILEILDASSNPRQYIVVTSDMADIGRAARSMGAEIIASKAFLSRVRGRDSNVGSGPPEGDAIDDLDYWLEKFGGGDEPNVDD